LDEDDSLPRRFVGLLWFMLTFMEWQIEHGIEQG
jgi:hypothetical protein